MARSGVPAWLACLLLSTALASTCGEPERKLTRQKARNWDAEARKRAASSAKAFLEQADQSLVVPVEVDVFLIGFEADGGYAHKVDSMMLQNLLNAGEEVTHCPRSLDTRGDLGLCFKVHYQVLGHAELGGEAGQLLRNIEAYLKPNLKDPFEAMPWARPRGRGTPGTPEPGHLEPTEYTVDAAGLEPLFEAFLEFAYGVSSSESDEAAKAGHNWHQHNPIFIINPSKVRINPKGHPEDQNHHVPDFFYQWHSHTYKPEELEKEEAGLTYRYSYNGAGASAAWTSSRNFVVVDVAAGPAIYGPAVAGRGGVVGPTSFPSLRDVYRAIFADLKDVGPTLTAQEHAQVVAEHAQRALFDGALSSTIVSATRSLFLPDTTTEHLEYARSLLIPVVLLTDYELSEQDYDSHMSQEDFMHINLTQVESSVARLIDESQEAVVVSAHHPLSRHKAIAAALWKARRTRTEQAVEQGDGKNARVGMHTVSHTSIDPDQLIEELALAADTLTHGLVSAAHAMSKEGAHPLEQLRHDGTRVVPVFVISLMKAPDDIMFENREMVVASHDAVVVLQLRQSAQWGGVVDSYWTGHMANGRRVTADARDVTRHIVAGLATALAGVVPPYSRPTLPGPARGPPQQDWRWAVGATPFGAYSNYSGISQITQNVARRNLLLAHTAAALREVQRRLDAVDEFVADHFEGPWAAAGVTNGKIPGRRHFLDTVVDTRHGYKTALTPDQVAALEHHMAALTGQLEAVSMDIFSHDFASADTALNGKLLPTAARLCEGLDQALDEARGVVACCGVRHVSGLGRAFFYAISTAVAFTVVFIGAMLLAVASGRKRRSLGDLGLPTYGMTPYNSRPSSVLGSFSRPSSRSQNYHL